MKKKTRRIIGIIGIIVGLLFIAAIIFGLVFSADVGKQVAEGILYMNAENDTKGNSVKHLEKRGYDIKSFEARYVNPSKETKLTTEESKLTTEEKQIKAIETQIATEDGNLVPAQIFTCEGSKKTVILVHGQGGDHVTNYPVAEVYLKNGWNVINFDQRGAGDNPDKKVTFGYYESRDVKALADYAKHEMQAEQIVVHGQSMGGATAAIYAASDHAKQTIDALVLDSCFDSMKHMFLGVWRDMEDTEGIPEDYIIACGNWYLEKYYDFGFEDADICEILKKDEIPTLMLQMERDELVPMEKAKEMYENIAAKDKQIHYFDSEHIDAVIDDPNRYEETVMTFLEK
ncbi:MAG: alpha/beta hydrolase [Clostridia bacterium]|nr:alpha/beta hydrolase [Clostridia bacterium]